MRILTQAILPIYIFNRPFSFLDIGCSNPNESCCYPLTKIRCKGHFVDINHFDGWDGLNFHQIDATQTNWDFIKDGGAEFLQIDVEGMGKRFEVLKSVPLSRLDTKIISIEHDGYQTKKHNRDYDSTERNPQRDYLSKSGWHILYKDVTNDWGEEYEDWWVRDDLWEEYKHLYCERNKESEIQIKLNTLWNENTYQH
jgi:hypothetical protein